MFFSSPSWHTNLKVTMVGKEEEEEERRREEEEEEEEE
jgi:hypothetical protein